jgi:hypothetical protein
MKRLIAASASGLAVAILAAACASGHAGSLGPAPKGVPSSSSPRPTTSPNAKPTSSPHPSPTQHPSGGKAFTYQVWFEQNGKLFVTRRTSPFTVAVGRTALTAMLAGPSSAERAAGVATAIPSGSRLLGLTITGGVATVDLSSEFRPAGSVSALSVAQVVYTITQYSNVKLVVLRAGGVDLFETAQTRAGYTDDLPAILVESPLIGAVVSNPVTVSGTANVFEATVSLRILDANGNEIARTFTQATCGTGCRGTFSVAVSYRVSSQQRGTIEVYESSAKDGSPINVVSIPVMLTP